MELVFIITTSVLSFLSLVSNIWVTIIYFSDKKLRGHPSPILAWISLFEISLSHHSIALAIDTNFTVNGHGPHHMLEVLTFFKLSGEKARSLSCAINQVMFSGSAAGVICYNTFFCADFIVTLRNPLFPGKKRMKIYHILASIIISGQVTYNIIWNLGFNECTMDAVGYLYEFWNNGVLIIIFFFYAVAGFSSAACCLLIMFSKSRHMNQATKDYFSRHILYIFVLLFIYTWSGINFCVEFINNYHYEYQQHNYWLLYTSTTLLSASGLAQAIIRNWEKSYWTRTQELCKRRFFHEEPDASSIITEFKQTNDTWNLPTSLIMQDSIRSNTTLCILWGLHEVLHKFNLKPNSNSNGQKSKLKIQFEKVSKMTVIDFFSFNYFVVKAHSDKTFEEIRKIEEVNVEDLISSFHPGLNRKTLTSMHKAEGRSGSLFIYTEDKKWVLKMITRTEMKFLRGLLNEYLSYIRENRFSMINRILGLYTVKIPGVSPLYLILSKCLIDEQVVKFYDLKGSTYHRNSGLNEGFIGPFKDLDFIRENQKFVLRKEEKEKVLAQIAKDSRFLMTANIMDYSLLVVIRNEAGGRSSASEDGRIWFQFHIIDFLGEFSLKRKAEYYMKRIKMGKKIEMCSVMNPKSYCFRFNKFFNHTVFA